MDQNEFPVLLAYLSYYATWFEVFLLVDGEKPRGDNEEHDRRLSAAEWKKGYSKVAAAGKSWAPYVALKNATAKSFDKMANENGYVLFSAFCDWIEKAEKKAGTACGKELAIGDEYKKKSGSSACAIL